MPMRRLTDKEVENSHLLLIDNLNKLADCKERKANFNKAIKEEIDYCEKMVGKIRQELNAGEVFEGDQKNLPL
jgi:hypothetical protein